MEDSLGWLIAHISQVPWLVPLNPYCKKRKKKNERTTWNWISTLHSNVIVVLGPAAQGGRRKWDSSIFLLQVYVGIIKQPVLFKQDIYTSITTLS